MRVLACFDARIWCIFWWAVVRGGVCRCGLVVWGCVRLMENDSYLIICYSWPIWPSFHPRFPFTSLFVFFYNSAYSFPFFWFLSSCPHTLVPSSQYSLTSTSTRPLHVSILVSLLTNPPSAHCTLHIGVETQKHRSTQYPVATSVPHRFRFMVIQ